MSSSIFKNSIFAISTHGVRAVGAVFVSLLVANGFSAKEFGDIRFLQLSVVLLATIAAPGMLTVSTKFFAQAGVSEPQDFPPIAYLWILSLVLAGIAALLCLFFPMSIEGASALETRLLFAGIVFVVSANFVPMGALMGLSQFFKALIVEIVAISTLCLGALYAIWSENLVLVIWTMLLSSTLALAINSWLAMRELGQSTLQGNLKTLPPNEAVARVLGALGPLALVGISIAATFWLVGWIIRISNNDPLIFALYSLGMQWFMLAILVPEMVGRVIFPKAVQVEADDQKKRRKLLWLSVYVAFGSTLLVAIVALVFSPFIIRLYGPQYADASLLIGIYAAAAIPYGVAKMISYAIVADNGEKSCVIINFSQLIIAAAAVLLFLSSGEISGAIALFVGACGALVLSVIDAHRRGLLFERAYGR